MQVKHLLITGCSSGIGLCAAKLAQQRGHKVVATVRKQTDMAQLTAEGIPVVQLDLDDSDSIEKGFSTALQLLDNHIDVLFNNAAYGQPGAIEDLSRSTLKAQFETNFFGTHELTNLALKQMRQQNAGRIIYNSSLLGYVALKYRGAYNASKFALEGLADTLRIELSETNIDIVLIEPGPISSKFRDNAMQKYFENIDKSTSPYKVDYEATEARLKKKGPAAPFTLPPEAVVKKLFHAIESKRPKARYRVTFPAYLLAFLKRALPTKLLDKILIKASD